MLQLEMLSAEEKEFDFGYVRRYKLVNYGGNLIEIAINTNKQGHKLRFLWYIPYACGIEKRKAIDSSVSWSIIKKERQNEIISAAKEMISHVPR